MNKIIKNILYKNLIFTKLFLIKIIINNNEKNQVKNHNLY
jgi:hypothetical protein